MPIYEYVCPDCETRFEQLQAAPSTSEKRGQVHCPKCGGKKAIRVFGRVAIGGSKEGSRGCSPSAGRGCCG